MTPNDELFSLIKSLTPSEKRYFKIWASRHVVGKSNNYEKLFDALDVLPDDQPYDEVAFKKTLRGKTYGKNLSDEKANLREILLRSMRVYHAEKTTEGRLSEMMQEIRFLYSKGLMDLCHDLIRRAYKIADQHEMLEVRLQLIYFVRLTDKSVNDTKSREVFEQWRIKEKETLLMLDHEREACYLKEQIIHLYYSRQMTAQQDKVDALYAQLEALERQKHISFKGFQYIINSKAVVLEHRQNYAASAALYASLIERWEADAWRMEESPERYCMVIKNALTQLFMAEKLKDMLPLLAKMKEIPATDQSARSVIFVNYWQFTMLYYLNTALYTEAAKLVPELLKGMKGLEKVISYKDKLNLYSNIILVYLHDHDYRSMLRTIDKVYALVAKNDNYNYVLRDMKYLEFIAHYETDGTDIIDHHIRNSTRFLKENKLNNDFTDMLWKRLKLLATAEISQRKAIRAETKKQVADATCPSGCQLIKEVIFTWL